MAQLSLASIAVLGATVTSPGCAYDRHAYYANAALDRPLGRFDPLCVERGAHLVLELSDGESLLARGNRLRIEVPVALDGQLLVLPDDRVRVVFETASYSYLRVERAGGARERGSFRFHTDAGHGGALKATLLVELEWTYDSGRTDSIVYDGTWTFKSQRIPKCGNAPAKQVRTSQP